MSTATVIIIIGPHNRSNQPVIESSEPVRVENQDTVKRGIEYTPAGQFESATEHVGPGSTLDLPPGNVLLLPYVAP